MLGFILGWVPLIALILNGLGWSQDTRLYLVIAIGIAMIIDLAVVIVLSLIRGGYPLYSLEEQVYAEAAKYGLSDTPRNRGESVSLAAEQPTPGPPALPGTATQALPAPAQDEGTGG